MSVVILSSVPLRWYCLPVGGGGGGVSVDVIVGDDVDDAVAYVVVLCR